MKLICKNCAVLAFVLFLASISHADVVDRIVAIVNDDVITLSEVNEEGKSLFQRVAEQAPPAELQTALSQVRQSVIEQLIEKKIMMQEAEKAHITVTDEEVDRALEMILSRNKTTMDQFRKQLASMGMTEQQYLKNLRSQVLSSKIVNYEVRSKLIIPESRIIDYYDAHYTERVGEGSYYLLQVGITWIPSEETGDQGTTQEEARKKAERIRSLALSGQEFRALARQYSDMPSAVDGGDIGVLNKDDMSAAMLDTISKTSPGEITPIIETSSEFQFFKVLSSQEGQIITKIPYESVKDEIHDTLYQQEIEARFAEWLKEAKNRSYIKIL